VVLTYWAQAEANRIDPGEDDEDEDEERSVSTVDGNRLMSPDTHT